MIVRRPGGKATPRTLAGDPRRVADDRQGLCDAGADHGRARATMPVQAVRVLSPLVAAVYLVARLPSVGAMQRFGLKWSPVLMMLMILAAAVFGTVSLFGIA